MYRWLCGIFFVLVEYNGDKKKNGWKQGEFPIHNRTQYNGDASSDLISKSNHTIR